MTSIKQECTKRKVTCQGCWTEWNSVSLAENFVVSWFVALSHSEVRSFTVLFGDIQTFYKLVTTSHGRNDQILIERKKCQFMASPGCWKCTVTTMELMRHFESNTQKFAVPRNVSSWTVDFAVANLISISIASTIAWLITLPRVKMVPNTQWYKDAFLRISLQACANTFD